MPLRTKFRIHFVPFALAIIAFGFSNVGVADDPSPTPKTFSAIGVITDDNGTPVAGAEIQYVYRESDNSAVKSELTHSNQDGTYRIDGLPIKAPSRGYWNSFRVTKTSFAIAQKNYMHDWLYEQANGPDGNIELDFILKPEMVGEIRVLDSDGLPLADVNVDRVQAKLSLEQAYFHFAEEPTRLRPSREQGVLRIPGLESGVRYDVELSHPDYASTPMWNINFDEGPIEMSMDPGIEVEFQVTCQSDPKAISQAEILVTVSEEAGHQLLKFPVDASGVVKARLRDKHASIGIEHPTLEGKPWYNFRANEPKMTFELQRTGIAEGTVVNEANGLGAEAAFIYIVENNRVIKQGRTDESGNYSVEVPEGTYSVTLGRGNSTWKRSDQRHELEIVADETTTVPPFSVTAIAPIKGQVVLDSGKPVPYAFVVTSFRGSPIICDEEGRFEIRSSRDFGALPIQAFHPTQKLSRVVDGKVKDEELKIELQDEASVLGVVVSENGKFLKGFPVCLHVRFQSTSTVIKRFATREDGTFKLDGLSPGFNYKIAVDGKQSSAFGFSDRLSVSNPWFSPDGTPQIERNPLEVGSELLAEVRELERSTQRSGNTLKPLENCEWERNSADAEAAQKRLTLLSFYGNDSMETLKQVDRYYGKTVRIIVIVPDSPGAQKTVSALLDQTNFEIIRDNDQSRLIKDYQVDMNDIPLSILFDQEGDFILRTTRIAHEQLLPEVRRSVLYQDQ